MRGADPSGSGQQVVEEARQVMSSGDPDWVPPSGGRNDSVLMGRLGEADGSHALPIYLLWRGSGGRPLHRAGQGWSPAWDLRQVMSGQILPE
ncbi:hypothetical protein E2562_025872 [Oryza meyeriana var. granulata]|uniref:Uncharacterized protein n=1 Tax=Oryza meyeriana var. granulata TaxID=110450 RepID=A0A6G1D7Y5_9ORYZ|nr:hypothetical protein E2562_025872 [Oryza meyeriana var. granulata]